MKRRPSRDPSNSRVALHPSSRTGKFPDHLVASTTHSHSRSALILVSPPLPRAVIPVSFLRFSYSEALISKIASSSCKRGALLKTAQRLYHCRVCLADFPEDDALRIDACGHEICRNCARSHVCSKIDEHRFPVLCPVCMADHGNPNLSSMYHYSVSVQAIIKWYNY